MRLYTLGLSTKLQHCCKQREKGHQKIWETVNHFASSLKGMTTTLAQLNTMWTLHVDKLKPRCVCVCPLLYVCRPYILLGCWKRIYPRELITGSRLWGATLVKRPSIIIYSCWWWLELIITLRLVKPFFFLRYILYDEKTAETDSRFDILQSHYVIIISFSQPG